MVSFRYSNYTFLRIRRDNGNPGHRSWAHIHAYTHTRLRLLSIRDKVREAPDGNDGRVRSAYRDPSKCAPEETCKVEKIPFPATTTTTMRSA